MSFVISFRSELLKTHRTSSWYLGLLAALLTPVIFLFDYTFQDIIIEKVSSNPWTIYIKDAYLLFNLLMLPMFTLLITTFLPQLEYRNNTWKQSLTSPQSLLTIYLTRYSMVLLLILSFIIAHDILLMAGGMLIRVLFPRYGFSDYPVDLALLFKSSLFSFLGVLGISAIEFWLGIKFRNFIIPIGIVFAIWIVVGLVTFELRLPFAYVNPFTHLVFLVSKSHAPEIPNALMASVVYCLLFLVIGYRDFRKGIR